MQKKLLMSLSLLLLVFGNNLSAQVKPYTISGKVTSFEESLALEGVSIYVKGTKNSTGTQPDGTFSLQVTPENKVLVFELREYESQEVNINGKKQYDIVLKRDGHSGKVNYHRGESTFAVANISKNKSKAYRSDIAKY